MKIEEKIFSIAKKYFNVTDDLIKVDHRLKGGMSNYTYLVYVDNKPYVIRVIGDKGDVIVAPKIEKYHLSLVNNLDITSKTIYFDELTGDKISEYIEGEVLSQSITDASINDLAKILKRLHHTPLDGFDYELKQRLRRYEVLLQNPPSLKYYELKLQWLVMYDKKYINAAKVFCHGDAQRSNLVLAKEGIKLLDFEFSGLNDPYYDIASFGNISFDDSVKLLSAYLDKELNKEELNKLRFYRMYQVLQWHIVAIYKHEVGLSEKLNMDFKKISDKYLNIANDLYTLILE